MECSFSYILAACNISNISIGADTPLTLTLQNNMRYDCFMVFVVLDTFIQTYWIREQLFTTITAIAVLHLHLTYKI